MQNQQPSNDTAPVPESSAEPANESGSGRVAMVIGDVEKEAAEVGKRHPDVSRMSRKERDAQFSKKRRERELEAIKKLGLNPEDFPSARSAVRHFTPLAGGRREERRPRPSRGHGQEPLESEQQQAAAPSQAPSSYNQPQASAGYGDERVSGWGSSSSDEVVNQPLSSSAVLSQAQSESGWFLDELAPAVPRSVPTYEAAYEAPKPAAPSSHVSSNPNDLDVSTRDIPESMPIAPAPVPAPAAAAAAAPSAGDNWKIDTAPVGQIPERRPLYSYEAEPSKPIEAISKPAGPVKTVVRNTETRAAPVKSAPVPAAVPVAQPAPVSVPAPLPAKPVQPVAAAPRAPSKSAGNPLDFIDSLGCDEPLPTAAPRMPEPVQAPRVPKPVVQPPSFTPSVPRVAPRPVCSPLEAVDSWCCDDPFPTAAPVLAAPLVPAAPLPVTDPSVAFFPPSVQAAPVQVTAPFVSAPRQKPAGSPLDYVDSWGCDEPITTAPAAVTVATVAPAAVATMAPGTVKCPNCQHCFRP